MNSKRLKKVIKVLKSLVEFLSASKDKTNNQNLIKEEQPLIEPKKWQELK